MVNKQTIIQELESFGITFFVAVLLTIGDSLGNLSVGLVSKEVLFSILVAALRAGVKACYMALKIQIQESTDTTGTSPSLER